MMSVDAVGGVWRHAMILGSGLATKGWHLVLAGMGPPPSAEQRAEARAFGATLEWAPYALEWMRPSQAELDAAGEWLLKLEREHCPAVVQLHSYAHAGLDWAAPVLVVAHSCVASWWLAVHGTMPPPEWDAYRARVALALGGDRPVVVPSAAFGAELTAIYGPIPRLRVIGNGMPPVSPPPVERAAAIMAAGRIWDEAKNLSLLDQAAAGLAWPVRLAGETRAPDGRCLELRHAQALGLVPDIAALLAGAEIFASPALYEPFGLAVLEAANAGCALVLSDIPTFRELWGGVACFLDPRDGAAWHAALQALTADPAGCRRRGDLARSRAARYTAEGMVAAYQALYAELGSARAAA